MTTAVPHIRKASPGEAGYLTGLALRSKAHWGYAQDFLEACREELTVDATRIGSDDYLSFIAVDGNNILGYYTLVPMSASVFELEALFVEPEHIGTGVGRALIEHAVHCLAKKGATRLIIQGDPNAEDFYIAAGARQTGTLESASIPGRFLPVFEIEIDGEDSRQSLRLDCGSCIVRNWRRSDKTSLLENASNRKIWRNLGDRYPYPYTESDADAWFAFLEKMEVPTHWAIEVDGRAVGGVGVEPCEFEYRRTGRFGYWLGEAYWGRGIMTAVAGAASDHALQQFELVRLEASVFAWNPASMRVLEKCGFVREGVLRRSICKDGEIIDSVLYAKVV